VNLLFVTELRIVGNYSKLILICSDYLIPRVLVHVRLGSKLFHSAVGAPSGFAVSGARACYHQSLHIYFGFLVALELVGLVAPLAAVAAIGHDNHVLVET